MFVMVPIEIMWAKHSVRYAVAKKKKNHLELHKVPVKLRVQAVQVVDVVMLWRQKKKKMHGASN